MANVTDNQYHRFRKPMFSRSYPPSSIKDILGKVMNGLESCELQDETPSKTRLLITAEAIRGRGRANRDKFQ